MPLAGLQGPSCCCLVVAVIGGGPGGLAAARAIANAAPHLSVAMYERSTLRPRGATLAVQPNGIAALEAIHPGLGQQVVDIGVAVEERRYAGVVNVGGGTPIMHYAGPRSLATNGPPVQAHGQAWPGHISDEGPAPPGLHKG